jgi:hypothetical protein
MHMFYLIYDTPLKITSFAFLDVKYNLLRIDYNLFCLFYLQYLMFQFFLYLISNFIYNFYCILCLLMLSFFFFFFFFLRQLYTMKQLNIYFLISNFFVDCVSLVQLLLFIGLKSVQIFIFFPIPLYKYKGS